MEEILHHVPRIYFFLPTILRLVFSTGCLNYHRWLWVLCGAIRTSNETKRNNNNYCWLIYIYIYNVGDECLWINMNQLEFDGNGIEIEEVSVAGWIGTKFPWTEPQKKTQPRPSQAEVIFLFAFSFSVCLLYHLQYYSRIIWIAWKQRLIKVVRVTAIAPPKWSNSPYQSSESRGIPSCVVVGSINEI